MIVNCKQFRNCVDKAIKPFDWLSTTQRERERESRLHGKCAIGPSRPVSRQHLSAAQTPNDNAIWIIPRPYPPFNRYSFGHLKRTRLLDTSMFARGSQLTSDVSTYASRFFSTHAHRMRRGEMCIEKRTCRNFFISTLGSYVFEKKKNVNIFMLSRFTFMLMFHMNFRFI